MSDRRLSRSVAVVAVIIALLAACAPNPTPSQKSVDVQELVAVLTSDASAQARADAATTLGKLGAAGGPDSTVAAQAVDHLTVALKDDDATVRAAAAGGIGGLGLEPGVLPLLTALDDEATEVRQAAQKGLSTLLDDLDDQTVSDALIEALDHQSATVRAAAAEGLKGVGQVPAIAPLLKHLDDPSTKVKDAAAATLNDLAERLPTTEVAGAFVTALGSESATVRTGAAKGLGGVGQEPAVLPLLQCLDDPSMEVKDAAANGLPAVLARLDDATAVTALLGAMKSGSTSVQEQANAALGKHLAGLGVERAVPAVQAAKAGDAWLAVALGVPQARVAAELHRLGIQLEPLDGIQSAASVARTGHRVTGAHRYVASSTFHPAVLFAATVFPGATVDRWSPPALRFLELVVTEKVTWQRIEVCRYYGPDITRYRAVVTVKVVSAATGKVVATRTYRGSAPRACRHTESYSLTVLRGPEPSLSPAIKWVNALIHPPA